MPGNRWVYSVDFTPSFLKMLFPHWRRQRGLTWQPLFIHRKAVLRRVAREASWLRRADGVAVRTGSGCEQQRQSQTLPLEAAVWTDDGREVRLSQKETFFCAYFGPSSLGATRLSQEASWCLNSDPWHPESHHVVSSGQEPRDFLASIPQMLESKTCNFTYPV